MTPLPARLASIALAIVVCSTRLGVAAALAEPKANAPAAKDQFAIVTAMERYVASEGDEQKFADVVGQCRELPDYAQSGVIQGLLSRIYDSSAVAGGNVISAGHRLTTVNQRAIWALARVTGLDLPLADARQDPNSRAWQDTSKAIINAYLKGRFDASVGVTDRLGPVIERGAYKGRIVPGITGDRAPEYAAAMTELLAAWSPIGRPFTDLTAIIGAEGETEPGGSVRIAFDTGFGSRVYRFQLRDGRIWSISLSTGS